jgi:shikimate kinase
VATGGGLPVRKENIKIMKDTGKVVWLRIDFNTFLSRTAGDENRPLLKEGLDELKNRFQTREEYYSKADIVIDGTKAVDDIVKEIKEKIE